MFDVALMVLMDGQKNGEREVQTDEKGAIWRSLHLIPPLHNASRYQFLRVCIFLYLNLRSK
jgi:hypothetical protein